MTSAPASGRCRARVSSAWSRLTSPDTLTKAAAQELGPRGIRVNGIVCGMFHTDSFHKSAPTDAAQAHLAKNVSLGRIGDADDIVGTALYLASDASAYLTGELIQLDGGGS